MNSIETSKYIRIPVSVPHSGKAICPDRDISPYPFAENVFYKQIANNFFLLRTVKTGCFGYNTMSFFWVNSAGELGM
ncbi:MAG: hypothetical protein H6Q14_442 [Bacteroidetes bacterium]|nr:hypothetical protein [Bacteroidota bacterium]